MTVLFFNIPLTSFTVYFVTQSLAEQDDHKEVQIAN